MSDRVMHLGLCEDCLTINAVWPHPERSEEIPDKPEWETFGDCHVCDGSVMWDETADVTDYLKRGF